ncbi:MAG: NAD(P)H-dependent oxidoreductase [Oscillospiraceae bacterium]|nr:NAD(P)H-dependent oxidoreductase [Oscillospiraceae bacterium]MDD4413928.1 NAD(P)H-dependent oxidoreductase [Oscillospiraceae bacterium]
MRVFIIFGSPKKTGSTAQILNAFISGLPDDVSVDIFDCFERSPLPCNDCRFCYEDDLCTLSDLDDFYTKLEAADILVFASPVYNLSFPAPMKALLDRLQRYWSARFIRQVRPPIKRSKRGLLITANGAQSQEGGEMLERQLKPILTTLNTKLIKSIHYIGADKKSPLDTAIKEAENTAHLLFE